ncbi:MAG: GNAT family N-acetyltransferase [Nanoarchaeota archaeon]|nr:GNAT family N-acetyltransferase [Nanoarchaeota archaeon]
MKHLKIRLIKNNELNDVFKIRDIVFIKGQKVPKERDRGKLDNYADNYAKHFIVLYNNRHIGCARVRFLNNKAKLERMAILKKYRRKGFGKQLLKHLISYCKRNKVKEIYCHAQYYIRNYYKSCGFKQRGKTFMDANMKHIGMFLKK